jgi:hypothetical protein
MTAQVIPPNIRLPLNLEPHTPEQIDQLMRLLDELIVDESGYEESTWDDLARAIERCQKIKRQFRPRRIQLREIIAWTI